MDSVPINNMLHRVQKLAEVDDSSKANCFLEVGWTLLQVRDAEYFSVYTLGWAQDGEPVWPEKVKSKLDIMIEELEESSENKE